MSTTDYAVYVDLKFPRLNPAADYDSTYCDTFNDRTLINVTQCWESSILFAAREGWVDVKAPKCAKNECIDKNNTSYCSQRGSTGK